MDRSNRNGGVGRAGPAKSTRTLGIGRRIRGGRPFLGRPLQIEEARAKLALNGLGNDDCRLRQLNRCGVRAPWTDLGRRRGAPSGTGRKQAMAAGGREVVREEEVGGV
ncbi:hypothetical protein PVAP13_8NG050500 [Panicum virgatum]|uniref:Uncharacterized protein n=1 Tax=Panicum virgatum TaxID=38727 RepID=A0A8T0P4H1_PANVG|nr:hypothetical protein PVAP13_8NG050500 [Panicum virgatum]